jgi:cytochrome b6-f complex iron-sulfur subunit
MSDSLVNSSHVPDDSMDPGSEEPSERRSFLGLVVGTVGTCYVAALGYPVYRYLASPVERAGSEAAVSEVTLQDAQNLPANSALMFKFGSNPALLIHHSDGKWSAFSAVCTHLGCTVEFQPAENRIHCACHGGVYDPFSGANVSGPPPKPLTAYTVKLVEKGIVVSHA